MKIITFTGSVYETRTVTPCGKREIRRVPGDTDAHPDAQPLCGDHAWVPLNKIHHLAVGDSALLEIQLPNVVGPTLRTTSRVAAIEGAQ